MSKTLKDLWEIYVKSSKTDDNFLDPQHTVKKHADRNGNGDDVFKASKVKQSPRDGEPPEDHGYDSGEDAAVYHSKQKNMPKKAPFNKTVKESSDVPEFAKQYAKNYLGWDNYVETPDGKSGAHVFEFAKDKHVDEFLEKIGGAPHPHGGKRVIVREEVEDLPEGIERVGAYTTQSGEILKLHKNTDDNKHHMLVNKNGDVIKSYYSSTADVHKKLMSDGLKGSIKEGRDELPDKLINPKHYEATHEASPFGGFRPKIVHKEHGRLMYLGSASYKKPEDAIAHAKTYLHQYSIGIVDPDVPHKGDFQKEEVDIEESNSRLDSPAFRDAQKNLANLKKGIKPPAVAKAPTWKQKMKAMDNEHKAKFKEHKKNYEHHKNEMQTWKDTLEDLKSGNLGIPKDDKAHQKGAALEIEGHLDHHYSKMNHHLQKMHYHNDFLDKPFNIKEETEISELSKDKLFDYAKNAAADISKSNVQNGKYKKRLSGINTAVRKITKESTARLDEESYLDELSKEKLGQYANRAVNDIRNSNQAKIRWNSKPDAVYAGSDPSGKYVEKTAKEMEDYHTKLATRREKGVRTAIKKLTKEDIINSSIDKYVTEKNRSLVDRLSEKTSHLSDAHRDLLYDLFESLTDENRIAMVHSVDTEEGINELLDFAISKRKA